MEAKIKNPVIDAIFARKSIRGYKPEPITADEMETLLACAMQAPSGKNGQPWILRATSNKELIGEISAYVVSGMREDIGDGFLKARPDYCVFHHAPSVVFVATPKAGIPAFGASDCGGLAQTFCLAATSMGLGNCIVGFVRPYLKKEEGKKFLEALNIPEDYEVLYGLAVGYPTRDPKPRERDHSLAQIID